ncbi:protein FAR1-RELATED SEQUENCE 5-like [Aegilops tauschii subsp. strangulata]|uniref:protein FAR1-RELATED SEQUENCE 5-like n=1 Tax=Aegilops tauschii subsp. strangulata TaxID=200361 RepID=UPI003CC8C339
MRAPSGMDSEEDTSLDHQHMAVDLTPAGMDTLSNRSNKGITELSDCSNPGCGVVDSITANPEFSELHSGRSAPKRKSKREAFEGMDYRIAPAVKSPFQKCVERAAFRDDADVFVPSVGTIFDSKDEAYDFYNMFSWECGFGMRYGKSSTNNKNYRTMQDIVRQCAGKEERPNTTTCRTGCEARIRLHRTDDHGWYVTVFINKHNHPLSVKCGEKKQWKSHSVISPLAKDFIRNLRENNIRFDQIYNILGSGLGSSLGVPFRKQTLRTLCATIAHDSIADDMAKTTSILQDMSATDPDFKVCVQVDGESRVKTVIWCNGKNRLDYAHFGDVVTFDTTYRTNLYNMPFGLFVGVNNHFQSIIFGGVLMVDEKTPTFEWAFRNFIDLMDGKHPTTILTDQCKAMQNALRSTMPHTRHRWCRWHVLKVLKEKIGHVYNKHSAFKKEFHAIVNEETDVESFERKWHQLIKKYKLQGNKYLRRIFKWRDMWAMPYFMGTFCAGMTGTQRSESANHLLKKFISRSSPMHLFVKQYNKLLDSRSQAEDEANYVRHAGGL